MNNGLHDVLKAIANSIAAQEGSDRDESVAHWNDLSVVGGRCVCFDLTGHEPVVRQSTFAFSLMGIPSAVDDSGLIFIGNCDTAEMASKYRDVVKQMIARDEELRKALMEGAGNAEAARNASP